jgi:hypothetical protein
MEKLLLPHRTSTLARCAGHKTVRLVHDTTELHFSGDREGLGILRESAKGMLAHVTLAVSGDDSREPLGVLNVHTYVRKDVESRRGLTRSEDTQRLVRTPRAEKAKSRWENDALETGQLLDGVRVVHVMDREANDFDVFLALARANAAFVIRSNGHRHAADGTRFDELLAKQPARAFRTVPIASRPKTRSRANPVRAERVAKLEVRWGEVTVARKQLGQYQGGEVELFAVHVFEVDAPEKEAPVDWMLLSNLPVSSLEEATDVVDHYRARWIVEEYFKALKTGCAIEQRQLCSRDALERALAIFVPMAWQLLRLRHLARSDVARDASEVLGPEQQSLLRAMLVKRRHVLAAKPTVRDVMLGIAALGGHIKNNGDPGWMVLGRGYERFLEADEVRELLQPSSDQS